MGFFKRLKRNVKTTVKDKLAEQRQISAANKIIKKAEREEYLRSKKVEAVKFAKQKAAYESKQKLKRLKEQSSGSFFGGLVTNEPTSASRVVKRVVKTKGKGKKKTKKKRIVYRTVTKKAPAPRNALDNLRLI